MNLDKLSCDLATMPRQEMIALLRSLKCNFAMDFDEEFLNGLSPEAIRHIILAVAAHARNVPAASGNA